MKLTRRKIRYFLSRIKNELDGGCEAPELPDGFKEIFESQEAFTTFRAFSVSWDVDEDDPWKIVPLQKSLMQQWNETLLEKVPILPETEEELQKQAEKIKNAQVKDEEDENEEALNLVSIKPKKKSKKK